MKVKDAAKELGKAASYDFERLAKDAAVHLIKSLNSSPQ